MGECSHLLGRLEWGPRLAPPATPRAPVLDLDRLCQDTDRPGIDPTAGPKMGINRNSDLKLLLEKAISRKLDPGSVDGHCTGHFVPLEL